MTPDWIKWQNKRKSCPQVPFGPAFALLSGVKLSEGVFFEDPPKCGQPPPWGICWSEWGDSSQKPFHQRERYNPGDYIILNKYGNSSEINIWWISLCLNTGKNGNIGAPNFSRFETRVSWGLRQSSTLIYILQPLNFLNFFWYLIQNMNPNLFERVTKCVMCGKVQVKVVLQSQLLLIVGGQKTISLRQQSSSGAARLRNIFVMENKWFFF